MAAEARCKVKNRPQGCQVFERTLFAQVDDAVDFVLSKLDRSVGTRATGTAAPVAYEIPKEAIAEIVVNAVAHRDYASNAAVQVSVFADRVEIWNPGRLPRGLRPEDLGKPHSSEPINPLIARPLYLAHYIESLGTGTLDVIRQCREAKLPLPDFEQRSNQFVVTLWRDWLTVEILAQRGITERQMLAVAEVKRVGRITNARFRELANIARKTAARDLDALVDANILERCGEKRGTHYVRADRK